MPLFSRKDLIKYAAEIVVVVLGILIAFQVEEWREKLAEARELDAAMVRLTEETRENNRMCGVGVPGTERMAKGALTILNALGSGRLSDSDIEQFDVALALTGFNPETPFLTTVAEEMISTDLLKNVADPELRRNVAQFAVSVQQVRAETARVESTLTMTVDELNKSASFKYTGSAKPAEMMGFGMFEQSIEVNYDFDDLVQNRYLKNLLIGGADVHVDRYRRMRENCNLLGQIERSLLRAADK